MPSKNLKDILNSCFPHFGGPIELLVALYSIIKPRYIEISNPLYNDAAIKKEFNEEVTDVLQFISKNPSQLHDLQEKLTKNLYDEDAFNLYLLTLFAALSQYIAMKGEYIRRLNQLIPLEIILSDGNTYIVSKMPYNPVHNSLPHRTRKKRGRDISDYSEVEKIICIQRETVTPIKEIKPINSETAPKTLSMFREVAHSFRIAVTPFMTELDIEFDSLIEEYPRDGKTPFWFKGIRNQTVAREKLYKILTGSLEQDVTILIFPELMIDQHLLASIKEWLYQENRKSIVNNGKGILMVVAGSFHIFDKGKLFNRSTVLNHKGLPEIVWRKGG